MVYFTYLGAFNFCNCHLKLPVLINSWKRRIVCYSSSKCMLAWYSRAQEISTAATVFSSLSLLPQWWWGDFPLGTILCKAEGRLWQGRNPQSCSADRCPGLSHLARVGGRWGKSASTMRDLGSFCRPTSSLTPPLPFFFFNQFLKNAQNWKKQVSVTMI